VYSKRSFTYQTMLKLATLTIATTLLTTAIGANMSEAKPAEKPLETKPAETKPVVRKEPVVQRTSGTRGQQEKPVGQRDPRQTSPTYNCPACGMG
jgi:hypothetical protein